MKTPSSELKRRAKQTLKGRYGLCIGTMFIVYAVVFTIVLIYFGAVFSLELAKASFFTSGNGKATFIIFRGAAFFAYVVMLSLVGLLTPGISRIYLNLCTGQPARVSDLLYAFQNKPHKFLGFYFMTILIRIVWGIPYFVVFAVSIITDFIPVMTVLTVLMYLLWLFGALFTMLFLSQSMFILIESPDKKVFASFRKSADMMKGYKGSLFYLYLSFFGIIVLGYCSFGIGFLWISPYIQCTLTEFYLDLKARYEPKSYDRYEDRSFETMRNPENQ